MSADEWCFSGVSSERAMPKRPEMARMRAAVAAGDPPASAGYTNDDGWHAAQDDWLSKWSVRMLPDEAP